jgi:ankyrin repeat protein
MKLLAYLVVSLWFSVAQAGSYEDFFVALKRDDPRAVQNLLNRGFDPNTPSPEGYHGLYVALRDGAIKAANALADWPKTNVDARTDKDETPLMLAALKGHTELVRKFVDKGADVNKTGWTPLHYAATSGHLVIMQMLLDEHAYIDAESPNGTTPLMMAAHYGSTAAVKLLLEAGADPRLKNELGLTAIDFANRASRPEAAELIAATIRNSQPKGKW